MEKLINVAVEMTRTCVRWSWNTISRVGQEDPRRVYHSFKVGISLTLVSLLYVTEPSFKGIGSNAMWAVITVVVVLDFTAGGTLFKGLNRGMGTLLAGSLAFLIEHIAQESGRVFHATFIGIAVFAIGTGATYVRFFPYIKKNYDYGVVIFISTFNLITISSFRVEHVLKLAYERAYTIAIGCAICLVMTLFIFPNWSGQYLHNSTASKLEGLAYSIQACVDEYFSNEEPNEAKDKLDSIYKGYKAVLDSKSSDETLAHASWEPRHSTYRLPWQQYVKLGDVLRHFSYAVVALHGCLQTEIQTPRSIRALFKDPCIRVATEVHKAVMELAHSIRKRRRCSPMILSDHLHAALQDLDAALNSQPRLFLRPNAAAASSQESSGELRVSMRSSRTESAAWIRSAASEDERKAATRLTSGKIAAAARLEFAEALPLAAFASLLVEAVARLDLVIEGVEELGTVANFRDFSEGDDERESVGAERERGNPPLESSQVTDF